MIGFWMGLWKLLSCIQVSPSLKATLHLYSPEIPMTLQALLLKCLLIPEINLYSGFQKTVFNWELQTSKFVPHQSCKVLATLGLSWFTTVLSFNFTVLKFLIRDWLTYKFEFNLSCKCPDNNVMAKKTGTSSSASRVLVDPQDWFIFWLSKDNLLLIISVNQNQSL